ncbi:MAG: pentapeptide repeat-containing protein [Arthrospira sp. SH-MAG29]|nr:pentapeptide repeat-containing protein [Arthrospira sp. SH-MAG29]
MEAIAGNRESRVKIPLPWGGVVCLITVLVTAISKHKIWGDSIMETNFSKKSFYLNLKGADLTNANLAGVSWGKVDFDQAIFEGANIEDADFSQALNLRVSQIKQAVNWQSASYHQSLQQELAIANS